MSNVRSFSLAYACLKQTKYRCTLSKILFVKLFQTKRDIGTCEYLTHVGLVETGAAEVALA